MKRKWQLVDESKVFKTYEFPWQKRTQEIREICNSFPTEFQKSLLSSRRIFNALVETSDEKSETFSDSGNNLCFMTILGRLNLPLAMRCISNLTQKSYVDLPSLRNRVVKTESERKALRQAIYEMHWFRKYCMKDVRQETAFVIKCVRMWISALYESMGEELTGSRLDDRGYKRMIMAQDPGGEIVTQDPQERKYFMWIIVHFSSAPSFREMRIYLDLSDNPRRGDLKPSRLHLDYCQGMYDSEHGLPFSYITEQLADAEKRKYLQDAIIGAMPLVLAQIIGAYVSPIKLV